MSKPTYEELEAQVKQLADERDAVVAENTTLKSFRKSLEDIRSSLIGGGHGYMAVSDMQAQNTVLDVVFDEFDGIDTPATDAVLASLRAEGVEMLRQKLEQEITKCYQDEQIGLDSAVTLATEFAAQLRSQSEQVKGGDL